MMSPGIYVRTRRYGLAFGAVVLALAVRLAFEPLLGTGQSGLVLLIAVAVTARLAGRRPAVFAAGLATLGSWFAFVEPRYSFLIFTPVEAANLLLLAAAAVVISILVPAQTGPGGTVEAAGGYPGSRERIARFRRAGLLSGLVLLLLAMTFMLASDMGEERELQASAATAFSTLDRSRRVLQAVETAQMLAHDYLLTGEQQYLNAYNAALAAEGAALDGLRRHQADNPEGQARIKEVSRLAALQISILNQIVSLGRAGRHQDALRLIAVDGGNRGIEKIREVLRMHERDARRQLAVRAGYARRQNLRMRWVLGLGSGSLIALLIVAGAIIERDIREREATRRALHENEERLRVALAGADAGAWEWDFDTGRAVWSDQLWRLYGLEPHSLEPTYEAWLGLIYAEDRQRVADEVARVAGERRELNIEFRVTDPDGSLRWVLVRGQPEQDEDGRVRRYLGIALDINERKRIEQAVRESEGRFAFVLSASQIGHWEFDLASHKAHGSPEHYHILGYENPLESWTLEDFIAHVVPEQRGVVGDSIRGAIASGGNVNAECRIRRVDGEERWIWACGQLRRNEKGEFSRMAGIVQDITERKLAQARIQQLNAELERRVQERTADLKASNKELEAFAYSVSHDLRAPLRGIDGWSLALVEDYGAQLDEQAQEYLARVRSEAQRLGVLIDDLLQLSRITRDRLQPSVVDLSAVAGTVAGRLRESYPDRRLAFLIAPGLTAVADARLLEIALTNLLDNAVKFTRPRAEARIEFSQSEDGGVPAFCVRDNGVGFDMAYAGKLFGAFQRLHRTSEFPGTGIGLATVQRIIRRHGGRVWAQAERDRGAAFFFTLGSSKLVSSNE